MSSRKKLFMLASMLALGGSDMFSGLGGASYEDINHETEVRKVKGLIKPYEPKKLGKRAKRRRAKITN